MRDYSTVSPQFWLGKTGRELRKSGAEAQVVAFYLMTSPHANMLGLYYLPVIYLAHETGLGIQGASKGLKRAIEAGFCSYDEQTEMVWVHEMAGYQVGRALKPGDKRCAGVRNEYCNLPENPFLPAFFECYRDDFHLTECREFSEKREGPCKGLASQEQDQDQEQEQDKNLLSGAEKNQRQTDTPGPVEEIFISLPVSGGGGDYPVPESYLTALAGLYPAVDIRQEIRNMRGWLDANPRRRKTRAGIKRFITSWLQTCQNSPPATGSRHPVRRDVCQISPPDTTIPDGFRGTP